MDDQGKEYGYKVETIELDLDPSIEGHVLGGAGVTNSASSVNNRPKVYLHDNNTPYQISNYTTYLQYLYLDTKESFKYWLNAPGEDSANVSGRYYILVDNKLITQILAEEFEKNDDTSLRKGHFKGVILDLLEIPSGVKTLPEGVCRSAKIQSIVLPEGLEIISSRAFSSATVPELNIPNSVKTIADYAFANASIPTLNISLD